MTLIALELNDAGIIAAAGTPSKLLEPEYCRVTVPYALCLEPYAFCL